MAKKLQKTLADYVVIGLSPALIMLLVGSMLYFLLEISYGGEWTGKLQLILFWVVMGIVLVTRIVVEEGTERGLLFGAALAGALALVMLRYIGPLGTLIIAPLLAFIWWTTHKLTLDCTLIDDTQDSSGEGLLQVTGLDPEASNHEQLFAEESKPVEPAKSVGELLGRFAKRILFFDRSKPHPPGAWVLYFALIAIPIFGVGQMFVRSDDIAGRRYTFQLAIVFLGALLGLLLTTSFLGLRRYLRQRKLEMPATMAATWIGVGGGLILGLLLLASLLPRANPEYSLAHWAKQFDRKLEANSFAILKGGGAEGEGTSSSDTFRRSEQGQAVSGMKPGEQPAQGGAPPQKSGSLKSADNERPADGTAKPNSGAPPQDGKDGSGGGKQPGGKDGQASSGPQQSGGGQQGGQQSGGQSSSQQQSSSQSQGNSQKQSDGKQQGQAQGDKPGQSSSSTEQAKSGGAIDPQNAAKPGELSGQAPVKPPTEKAAEQTQPQQATPPQNQNAPATPPPAPSASSPPLSSMLPSFSSILTFLKYAVFICVAAYLIFRYWSVVSEALRDFFAGLRDFWALLFAKKPLNAVATEKEAAAPVIRSVSFADFHDPFQSGKARKWNPHETLQYTFAALEGWANDRGLSRQPDETPLEFTERLAIHEPAIAESARLVGRLVARVAYGRAKLDSEAVAPLSQAWEAMRAPRSKAAAVR